MASAKTILTEELDKLTEEITISTLDAIIEQIEAYPRLDPVETIKFCRASYLAARKKAV